MPWTCGRWLRCSRITTLVVTPTTGVVRPHNPSPRAAARCCDPSPGSTGRPGPTHRAVDAEGGVAAGSTANYFSSRDALFRVITERLAERERATFEDIAATVCPRSPAELGRAL